MNRADVVLVDFPYTMGAPSKVRLAVVVQNARSQSVRVKGQNERDNQWLSKAFGVMVTGNVRRAGETAVKEVLSRL